MNGKRVAGAIAGGLVAGVDITAMLMRNERKSSEPSEIANIKRAGLAELGREVPSQEQLPDTREQVVIQGGHLYQAKTKTREFAPFSAPFREKIFAVQYVRTCWRRRRDSNSRYPLRGTTL